MPHPLLVGCSVTYDGELAVITHKEYTYHEGHDCEVTLLTLLFSDGTEQRLTLDEFFTPHRKPTVLGGPDFTLVLQWLRANRDHSAALRRKQDLSADFRTPKTKSPAASLRYHRHRAAWRVATEELHALTIKRLQLMGAILKRWPGEAKAHPDYLELRIAAETLLRENPNL